MIKLKQLLIESDIELVQSKNPVINRLLQEIKPLISDVVDRIADLAIKNEMRFTDYDRKLAGLTLQFDLVKSLEKYTLPTDRMTDVTVRPSKGSLIISATIERDGRSHLFTTDVIYAGGYNIQKLHFRYLTKTSLPVTGESTETNRIKAELAKLSKGEKIKKEIEEYQSRYDASKVKYEKYKDMTDEEIIQYISDPNSSYGKRSDGSSWLTPYREYTWDELNDGGKANFDNDPAQFEKHKLQYRKDMIDSFKTRYIQWPLQDMKWKKEYIAKAEKKLAAH